MALMGVMLLMRQFLAIAGYHDELLYTASFGFLLLGAYLFGHLFGQAQLPFITGYIMAGIVLGPYCFDILRKGDLDNLAFIYDEAGDESEERADA